jgi:hypothetical protein
MLNKGNIAWHGIQIPSTHGPWLPFQLLSVTTPHPTPPNLELIILLEHMVLGLMPELLFSFPLFFAFLLSSKLL